MNIASEGKGTKYSTSNIDLVTTNSLKLVEIEQYKIYRMQ